MSQIRCQAAWAAVVAIVCAAGNAVAQPPVKPDQQKQIEAALPEKATAKSAKPRKVLIFTHAAGFVHGSVLVGAKAVELMGQKTGAYSSVTTNDPAAFDDLNGIDAIVMVNTTGNWLLPRASDELNKLRNQVKNDKFKDLPADEQEKVKTELAAQEQAFKVAAEKAKVAESTRRDNLLKFLADGGGLVGFHAASDAQNQWPEFGLVIGGYFDGHPWHEKVGVKLDDPEHPLLAAFEKKDFEITDEIYQFRAPYTRDNLRILMKLDVSKTNMNKNGVKRQDGDFAVSWVRRYGKGRVFYSSLGHREEIYWNPTILKFYLDGIQFALGDLEADATASSLRAAGQK